MLFWNMSADGWGLGRFGDPGRIRTKSKKAESLQAFRIRPRPRGLFLRVAAPFSLNCDGTPQLTWSDAGQRRAETFQLGPIYLNTRAAILYVQLPRGHRPLERRQRDIGLPARLLAR